MEIKDVVLTYLMPTLGVPKFNYRNIRFNCPKPGCDQGNKYNLEIWARENLNESLFNCWSCHYKGHITKLLKDYAINNSWEQISDFSSIYNKPLSLKESNVVLELPKSIIPFYLNKEVERYLVNERGIDKQLLIERKVGYIYSEDEYLYNHIIFPFYDISGKKLTGFSVQNFKTKKYKNFGKRNFIPYIQFINTNFPITITEGIYDCLSVFNAIPLLGTSISKTILEFLTNKNVIVAVDNEVSEEDVNKLINDLFYYNTNLICTFQSNEYKDLNKFRVEDKKKLIEQYKELFIKILTLKN